ncbi:hypothetical protein CHS0354_009548 [Potamilus streckersoni]|uniref:Uncharacterized protein n=1 Tax=Potamilus streckersoni TaxID=2493646 RepID=A0AAE0W045_9BIVA|nr:hypothetical protein CHS0354_009548 [Potamilus streckersoni]
MFRHNLDQCLCDQSNMDKKEILQKLIKFKARLGEQKSEEPTSKLFKPETTAILGEKSADTRGDSEATNTIEEKGLIVMKKILLLMMEGYKSKLGKKTKSAKTMYTGSIIEVLNENFDKFKILVNKNVFRKPWIVAKLYQNDVEQEFEKLVTTALLGEILYESTLEPASHKLIREGGLAGALGHYHIKTEVDKLKTGVDDINNINNVLLTNVSQRTILAEAQNHQKPKPC